MPVKWTAELDQILLLKILKKANLKSADFEAIAAEWPTDKGPKPTPRAISEHICKMAKTGTASGASNNNSGKALRTPTSKNTTPLKATSCGTPSKASKRKREITPSDKDEEEELEDHWKGGDDSEDEATPAKKTKGVIKTKNAAWAGAVRVLGSGAEDVGQAEEYDEGTGPFANGVDEGEGF